MFLLLDKRGYDLRIGLKSNECIDLVLKPLTDHATIKVNGSLTSTNIFHTVVSISVGDSLTDSALLDFLASFTTGFCFTLFLLNVTVFILSSHFYISITNYKYVLLIAFVGGFVNGLVCVILQQRNLQ
jgi:hypothetical protein